MRQQTRPLKEPAEKGVQDIRRATRNHYSAEEKIRIVLEGLRGEDSIAELCRREGIAQNLVITSTGHADQNLSQLLAFRGTKPTFERGKPAGHRRVMR